MKKNGIIFSVIGLIVVAAIITSVMMLGGNGSQKGKNVSNGPVSTNLVEIQSRAFTPATITVKAGTTVSWMNKDSLTHTVTADSGSGDTYDSGNLEQNRTFSHTYASAGTYTYHCSLHPDMKGTVIVTE